MNTNPHAWPYGTDQPEVLEEKVPTRTTFLVGESVIVRKTRKQGTVAARRGGRYLVAIGKPGFKRWYREGELWDRERWVRQQVVEETRAARRISMQAKDVPELPILQFLRDMPEWAANRFSKTLGGEPNTNSILHAMPEGVPEKVVLAKMDSLIRRGLVDGCACGCRGDFRLTEKGVAYLAKKSRMT